MDKRELRIDYFICRDSYPEEYAELCKKLWKLLKKPIVFILILQSELPYYWRTVQL